MKWDSGVKKKIKSSKCKIYKSKDQITHTDNTVIRIERNFPVVSSNFEKQKPTQKMINQDKMEKNYKSDYSSDSSLTSPMMRKKSRFDYLKRKGFLSLIKGRIKKQLSNDENDFLSWRDLGYVYYEKKYWKQAMMALKKAKYIAYINNNEYNSNETDLKVRIAIYIQLQ